MKKFLALLALASAGLLGGCVDEGTVAAGGYAPYADYYGSYYQSPYYYDYYGPGYGYYDPFFYGYPGYGYPGLYTGPSFYGFYGGGFGRRFHDHDHDADDFRGHFRNGGGTWRGGNWNGGALRGGGRAPSTGGGTPPSAPPSGA